MSCSLLLLTIRRLAMESYTRHSLQELGYPSCARAFTHALLPSVTEATPTSLAQSQGSCVHRTCTVGPNHANRTQILTCKIRIPIPDHAGRRTVPLRGHFGVVALHSRALVFRSCTLHKFLGGHDSGPSTWMIYASNCSRSFWGQGVVFAVNPRPSSPSFL